MATLPWRSIVTSDGWKLNLCAGDQSVLFDLNADPCEQTNHFHDPAHRDRIRELAARIRLWARGLRRQRSTPLRLKGESRYEVCGSRQPFDVTTCFKSADKRLNAERRYKTGGRPVLRAHGPAHAKYLINRGIAHS